MKINQCFFLMPIGLCAVFFDLRKGKIPNELIVIGLILGCCFQIRQAKAVGLLLFLGGACIPVVLGAGIYYFRMMGAGDMKLWAVVGGFLGPQRAVYCMIASLFVVDFCIAQKKKSKDKAAVLLFLYSKAAEWCLGAISE